MTKLLFTASSASRAEKCLGSGLFNAMRISTSEGAFGSAGHESLYHRAILGVDEAMARLPAVCERWGLSEQQAGILTARLRKFAWSPPPASVGELSLVLCDGEPPRVVRSKGGKGCYDDAPENAITAGQLDIMWAEPSPLVRGDDGRIVCPPESTLVVADFKFGEADHFVEPIERNFQLAINATTAALFTGAKRVVPVILWVRGEHGEWDTGPVMTEVHFAATIDRVRRLRAARIAERERIQAKHLPVTHEGAWCAYCPSESSCPTKLAAVRAALANDTSALVPVIAEVLTLEQARKIPLAVRALDSMKTRLKAAADTYVRNHGPITYEDGTQYGKVVIAREEIDGAKALPVLQEELGDHLSEALDVSKAAIERAIVALHEEQGLARKKTPAMRRVLAKLHETGAIAKVGREEMRLHRPADAKDQTADPVREAIANAQPSESPLSAEMCEAREKGLAAIKAGELVDASQKDLPGEPPLFADADDGPL